ncbi:MAG: hypothetical protein ACXV8Q_04720 [Methylobacter sp.]
MSKRTTSSVPSIDIKEVGAADRLHGSVRFRYTMDGKPVEHTVYLMQTDCHYGGVRHWFRCEYCQGRVGVLYLSGGQCACRKCFKLAYKSEQETKHDRLFRKAGKIRRRLGWQSGIALPDGAKPKGMHWKTFYRMKAEHDVNVQRICGLTAQWCAKITSRLQR